ncbi:glyoxylase-like metal-dependent hydrolase (beta-lactamase superfamily II) [Humitalea rosea]|uniref:Glyoxylase-like metal-dependent hydrolase (Beta-lactamase superfamily II) n=1 Tax=Humitalea rosea TaxID=990373 RepID=A0A2W7HXC0_9PROT|nr:N-acyl homoserine lactonase family protein [Humitalea rosea]PZW39301.1 glyoxylase-like metal-dependent hydrolase (beta-lactamase superfamily II) [Humitalea rosea]
MVQDDDIYEIHAVKYAENDRPAYKNFLDGDPHDNASMPLDYFVWAIVGKTRSFVLDTGFDAEVGAKRGRSLLRTPAEGLKMVGVDAATVADVVLSHMHYDHAGNHTMFPAARYHLQDREMAYCTGRCMCHLALRHPFEAADVTAMVGRVFEGRASFHDGAAEIAPGVSLHHVGGHSLGLQVMRVRTRRGWVVLASDASHFYANFEQGRPFPIVADVPQTLEGYAALHRLASSRHHIVPGHDPLVLARYPSSGPGLEGIAVRLDADPVGY